MVEKQCRKCKWTIILKEYAGMDFAMTDASAFEIRQFELRNKLGFNLILIYCFTKWIYDENLKRFQFNYFLVAGSELDSS